MPCIKPEWIDTLSRDEWADDPVPLREAYRKLVDEDEPQPLPLPKRGYHRRKTVMDRRWR